MQEIRIHLNLMERHHWSRSLLPGIIQAVRGVEGVRILNHEEKSLFEVWREEPDPRRTALLGLFDGRRDREDLRAVRKAGTPVINMSGRCPPEGLPSVLHDDRAIGRMAAAHLLETGERRFSFMGLPENQVSRWRLRGFRETLAERGLDCAVYEERPGEPTMEAWLSGLPTPAAVFAATDTRARALCQRAEAAGLRMPEELALLGVDNDPFQCDLHRTPLSSVEPDFFGLGFRAAKDLCAWLLEGRAPERMIQTVAPLQVEARRSSDPWHTADPLLARAVLRMKDPAAGVTTVAELARQLGVSRRSLELRCRDVFGRTPLDILNRIRMERAYQLLRHNALDVRGAMERTGFRDERWFRRKFREIFGRGPAE